ncbi:MAG TPA: peptide MFS transporter [Usitatibacter sp.]|nr:peptide MFS transporter [Usitatibacter sp.]
MAVGTTHPHARLAAERQPRALATLFFTEMWERFSYYGMRALLVLYLVHALGYPRADALELYATYTGLVYITPILGGYIADRYLGTRKAILVGGITMAMGHFAMAFPPLLHLALGLLVAGNGFFKPNITTLLGTYYRERDPRRDPGFTLFYMGINLGAFFSPLVAGTLGEKVGWHYGFASAGVGMCLGLAQFVLGRDRLGSHGLPAGKTRLERADWTHVILIAASMIPLAYAVMGLWGIAGPAWRSLSGVEQLAVAALVVSALWFGANRLAGRKSAAQQPLTSEEWQRIVAIFVLGFFVVFFWMGFEQAGGTMNLFADQQTERRWLGWEIPASYFQAINPLGIFVMGPGIAAIWLRVDRSRFALSTPAKMALGLFFLGLGFVVMAAAQGRADAIGRVGPQWLFFVYVLHTIGELCLSPVGLSMVTKLAPARVAALMMGIWFVANAAANYLAGVLEELLKGTSIPLYGFLVATSFAAGLVLLALTPLLKRLMHGKG